MTTTNVAQNDGNQFQVWWARSLNHWSMNHQSTNHPSWSMVHILGQRDWIVFCLKRWNRLRTDPSWWNCSIRLQTGLYILLKPLPLLPNLTTACRLLLPQTNAPLSVVTATSLKCSDQWDHVMYHGNIDTNLLPGLKSQSVIYISTGLDITRWSHCGKITDLKKKKKNEWWKVLR